MNEHSHVKTQIYLFNTILLFFVLKYRLYSHNSKFIRLRNEHTAVGKPQMRK